jgi:WD40 repeat protein
MGDLSSLVFSPDSKILAAARNLVAQGNVDHSILLWDVASRQQIGQRFMGHANDISSLVFHPDGNILASAGGDGLIILWNLESTSWIAKSCQRAGRNLTRAEWALYFPDQEYRATCHQWPLEPAPEVPNSLQ